MRICECDHYKKQHRITGKAKGCKKRSCPCKEFNGVKNE